MPRGPAKSAHPPINYKGLVTRWTTEVWNNKREEVIDEMMSPQCVVQVEGMDGVLSLTDFKAYRRAFLNAVPDLWVDSVSITTEGETSVQCWHATGTHLGHGLGIPPSHRRVDFTGVSGYEFQDGLIIRGFDRWNRGEMIASLMQVRMDELRLHVGLTKREAQVALMMAERYSFREIAEQLRIQPNTSRRHCERVLWKLGLHRRQDVAQALGKVPGSVLSRHGEDLEPNGS